MKVRGVDGCRAGWLAVSIGPNQEISSHLFSDAEELLELDDWEYTAIDIPIGLPTDGPRQCDIEARKVLGMRQSSVFSAPVRSVLSARTYEEACELSLRACKKKLSKQAFAILPRIRQVDELLRREPSAISRVREVHPEVCFACWNQQKPMTWSKSSGFGFIERFTIVDQRFPDSAERIRGRYATSEVADDDILDALAALWTAIRIGMNTAVQIGPADAYDECGLPMSMWA